MSRQKSKRDKNYIFSSDDYYQVVFEKGNSYITSHLYERKDGFWKVFRGRKRIGTFDKTLTMKIGD